MDKSNIVKLAKLFGKFTELESSFVLTEDIKAVRRCTEQSAEGMEIITPHGIFYDSMDFNNFKVRIGDIQEALKEKEKEERNKPKRKVIPITNAPSNGVAPPPPPSFLSDMPKEPFIPRQTTVTGFGKDGATGKLFSPEEKLKVVNRESLVILDSNGAVLAKGSDSGQIVGDDISGIIYQNGKYMLADKRGSGIQKVVVKYRARKE
jgi:hypothetical protein